MAEKSGTFWVRSHADGVTGMDLRWGRIVGVLAGGIFLLWLLLAATVSVGTGEIAVMTRFGRVTGQELGEGFHVKNPFDRANKYDVKVLKEDAKAAAASKDLQDIHATLVLNYRLEPGEVSTIHQKVGVDYADKLIRPALQEVFKATSSRYTASELITERPKVKIEALDLLHNRLTKFGIEVTDLSVTNFAFSAEFTQAIESKQIAQQEAERAKFRLEAAKTEAEAQKAQSVTLSDLFLRKLFLEKWDGHMPNVMAGGDPMSIILDGAGGATVNNE